MDAFLFMLPILFLWSIQIIFILKSKHVPVLMAKLTAEDRMFALEERARVLHSPVTQKGTLPSFCRLTKVSNLLYSIVMIICYYVV